MKALTCRCNKGKQPEAIRHSHNKAAQRWALGLRVVKYSNIRLRFFTKKSKSGIDILSKLFCDAAILSKPS